ncbi:MaoC/PaaZ C-terminal domain-containing protein [Croceicoccus sp. F390]|uniref:MaoC/PaaZ C-terminal domain-containing protein n=1 Tax=Croceicoccus esteveae TaxID=3075597 RepID=A0ABU2ZFJ9_9SPHN|nr:MaoC/PaaZ C-terminal domain-containing protein [Croceicoccus sp. F390]MDT0575377.1 MaoC/PaaZ C-terminal domain-containing protein [Croceicoccus sp. F390]
MAVMKYEDIKEGAELPPLTFPVSASAIVTGAIATNDYQNVHHDKAAAEATGVPDIFMNILTTNGIVQRYVQEWAQKPGAVRSVKIRLGAPNFAGDTMVLRGTVANVDKAQRTAAVAVEGTNSIGKHVTATVVIGFDEKGAA